MLVLLTGLFAIAIELRFALPRIGLVFGPLTLALALVIFVPGLAVQTRRLHDVSLSGWWALVMWGPYLAATIYFSSQSDLGMSMLFDPEWMSTLLLFNTLQALGGFALISLLVQRGRRRPNKYGDDPYQLAEPATA